MSITLNTPTPPPPPQTTGLRARPRLRRNGKFAVRSHSSYSRHRRAIMIWIMAAALCAVVALVTNTFGPAVVAGSSFGLCILFLLLAVRRVRRAMPQRDDELSERFEALAQRMENMEIAGWLTRQSEDVHRSVTEAFGDVVIHRDADGTVTFMNSTAKALFAGTTALPPIEHCAELQGQTRIMRVDTPTGEKIFRWGDLPAPDAVTGKPGMRSFGRDITAERRDRAALETALHEVRASSHERDRVLAMVGHDLRAPATNIVGLADWLGKTELTPDQRDHVDTIRAAARQQLDLVDDVLTEAAANRSKDGLRTEPVDLRVLVEGVARTLAPKAAGLAFATRVAPNVAATVELDGARLRQVLLNLASNAIKFTPSGGVSIEVEASDKGITLSVSDSGPGVPEAERETIFQDFVRSQTADCTEGNGLGLPIARNWIDAMGGTLNLVDSPVGARFEAFIPMADAQRKAPAPNRRGTVGLALDASPARDVLAASLHDLGYTPLVLEDADQFGQCGCVIGDKARSDGPSITDSNVNKAVPQIAMHKADDPDKPRHWLKWPVRLTTLDTIVMGACDGNVERSRYRVLLVEDDPVAIKLTRHALVRAGHKVSVVETLAAGRSALSAASFDVALIDGTLPDGDGIAFIADMTTSGDCPVKMVLLTAAVSPARREAATAAGAVGVCAKPLDADELDALIRPEGPVATAQAAADRAPALTDQSVAVAASGKERSKGPALKLVVG